MDPANQRIKKATVRLETTRANLSLSLNLRRQGRSESFPKLPKANSYNLRRTSESQKCDAGCSESRDAENVGITRLSSYPRDGKEVGVSRTRNGGRCRGGRGCRADHRELGCNQAQKNEI